VVVWNSAASTTTRSQARTTDARKSHCATRSARTAWHETGTVARSESTRTPVASNPRASSAPYGRT
jgi:hypothetical protein